MESRKTIAKLSRPRLYHCLRRERLFAWLDKALTCQAAWITAPPGAGKTALVSSYIEARSIPAIWYQVDGGDADPASFFYYLSSAAATMAALATAEGLPLFGPEYLADLQGFARHFFREVYASLPQPCLLAFDNYHAAPPACILHDLMAVAIAEAPPGVTLIVTSRLEPPAALSRLQLSRALLCLDQRELQVNLDEAREIAALEGLHPVGDAQAIRHTLERSGGWAAGCILMLGHLRNAGGYDSAGPAAEAGSRETLFRYFAVEIFEAAGPQARHLLLRTAFLPFITARMAEAITGDRDAGLWLGELYRQRYFIDRREAQTPTYHYHALFREFLQQQARQALDPTECLLLLRRCASLLEAEQEWEHACALHIATADWAAVAQLARQQASELLRQGRWQTLKSWIEALPAGTAADAWLLYWRGACDMAIMPKQARVALESAYDGFEKNEDAVGKVMAASAVMETYYFEWTSFAPLDRWIEVLAQILPAATLPTAAVELRARSALLAALLYRRPQHPHLQQEGRRILALLDEDVPVSARFTAGTILLNYRCFQGDLEAAGHVVALLRPQATSAELTPLNQVWWRIAVAYYLMLCAEQQAAAAALDDAADLADEFHLGFIKPAVMTQRILLALSFDDTKTSAALLTPLETMLEPRRRMDVALFHTAKSWHLQLGRQRAEAMKHAQCALSCAFETGAVTIQSYCLLGRAQLQLECKEVEQARENARAVREGAAHASDLLEFDTLLLEAACALEESNTPALRASLGTALAIGRRHGYANALRWRSPVMTQLLNHALEAGIEADYARYLIRLRRLAPPSQEWLSWPWPIRIYSLGRFALVIDDEPLKTSGKAQARPLSLLKALVAHGGREIGNAMLAALLWPDLEGDAAQHALDTALHRLRKLLRHEDAVVAHDGKLSLNSTRVWVDAWTFERLANRVEQGQQQPVDRQEEDRLLRLYAGHFLQQDSELPWVLAARERLRGKFVRLMLACGMRREQDGEWERAADIYQRGIDIDNLAEDLYRRLMLCHEHCGRPASALEAYSRYKQMLSIVRNIAPGKEIEALYRQVAQRAQRG